MKATKTIRYVKGEGTVYHNTESKWFKKFCLGRKNLNNQTSSSGLKTMDSESMLQAIEENLASSI